MSRRLLLGADLGGTWLRLCLADDSGRFLRRVRVGAVPWPQAPARIAALLKRWNNPKLSWLLLGGKGLRGRREQKALRRALRGLADRIVVISDLELSHRAAFRGGTGVLLIAGTGSSALGRDRKGRWRYAGGWGPLLGDEGSAFWIGKEALKDSRLSRSWPAELPLRLARHPNPVRATAALARRVLKLAERGDPAAAALRRRAAKALAALAGEAAAGLPSPAPLALHGGLFSDRALRKQTLSLLRGFRVQVPAVTAEQAAALAGLGQKRYNQHP